MATKRPVQYLIIVEPPGDEVQKKLQEQFRARGGKLSQEEFFRNLFRAYNHLKIDVCGEEKASRLGAQNSAYRLVEGMVFLPQKVAVPFN